jgi:hypothetical protein
LSLHEVGTPVEKGCPQSAVPLEDVLDDLRDSMLLEFASVVHRPQSQERHARRSLEVACAELFLVGLTTQQGTENVVRMATRIELRVADDDLAARRCLGDLVLFDEAGGGVGFLQQGRPNRTSVVFLFVPPD